MKRFAATVVLMMALAGGALSAEIADLAKLFQNPPDGVKPYVFWYWINGNISREGLAADLEAMHEAGIGGAMIFNIGGHSPAGPVRVMSPEWRELMKFAMLRANELGLKISLYNSPAGWSSSGGPWITPELSMQEVTWSELQLEGGKTFSGQLPQPATKLGYYRDIAVLAFPTPGNECAGVYRPAVRLEGRETDIGALLDSDRNSWQELKAMGKKAVRVELEFAHPVDIRSFSMTPRFYRTIPPGKLFASDDGKKWSEVLSFQADKRKFAQVNDVFPQRHEPYWRIEFSDKVELAEINLGPAYRIPDWTGKAMFDWWGLDKPGQTDAALAPTDREMISREQMIDLTGRMDAQGHLNWTVPAGNWTLLRFGHTSTGMRLMPALEGQGGGLECDKLRPDVLDLHWKNAMQPWIDDEEVGDLFQAVHIDSYERHNQNWTAAMPDWFQERNGYAITPFLPALTGRVVGGLQESERFLWDFRKTVTGLMHEHYFGRMQQLCEKNGKQLSIENYGQHQFNTVTVGGIADVPMCEVWTTHNPDLFLYTSRRWSTKLASSPAHVYGKPIVQCEVNTDIRGDWNSDFEALKRDVDATFCGGVNRMVFHVYVHQPWDDLVPGQTLAVFGTHFERSNTWWGQMPGFTRYISRAQLLLQQGRFMADLLYCSGENVPNAGLELAGPLAPPPGYDYDVCDPYVVMNRLRVEDGDLVLPDGVRYRMLILPDEPYRTPGFAARIKELVAEGAMVVTNTPVVDVVGQMGLTPDFFTDSGQPIHHIHKQIAGQDVYFIANPSEQQLTLNATFRVEGAPELWNPLTGEIRVLPEFQAHSGVTVVPMQFAPKQSFFVVFKKGKTTPTGEHNFYALNPIAALGGGWNVEFHFRDSPSKRVTFQTLQDWCKRPEPELKYFSGTATYSKAFDLPKAVSGKPLYLDLGKVKNVAEVRLNGKELGTIWCAPWRVEISEAIRAKENQLEIDVVNLWPNRMIGDEQLPADCDYKPGGWALLKEWPQWYVENKPRTSGRKTFSTFKAWHKTSPLLESGLIGPVTIQVAESR
ncbi:hypothetical protein PDESU_01823 [Pontiella desulfatans]|uniref:Beta-mannosidase-like galactose-binding domain-containing protein n=1 Tax=Pontiella desulfatans TaxID=2750659 RepID=A0A6C2U065_PONDE|nr:glycosyl hydrolase [Pontiella desulfatans]VGO13267.1 hypothetical protein PDESU_01823 [Pontiella desulfatans]